MKKTWIFIIMIAGLISCEKAINITTPTILIENETLLVGEQIKIKVEEYAEIDGKPINADYFEWFIEDSQGLIVKDDFKDSAVTYWSPENAGYFVIKVKIGYDKNKSITAVKEVNVYETTFSLIKKLVGHWKGIGTRWYDSAEWGIDLFIDSTGHYYGTADFYSFDPYCEKGVFNEGRLDYAIGSYLDSCGVPGEVSCARFELNEVLNNKGFGKIWIGNIDYVDGEFFRQYCYDPYVIEDLEISADKNNLYFEFNDYDYAGTNLAWRKKFNLIRQPFSPPPTKHNF